MSASSIWKKGKGKLCLVNGMGLIFGLVISRLPRAVPLPFSQSLHKLLVGSVNMKEDLMQNEVVSAHDILQSDPTEAKRIFLFVKSQSAAFPDIVSKCDMGLAWCESRMHNYDKSSKLFEKIVHVNPDHELSSIGLFISLINLGEEDEAFQEVRRFIKCAGRYSKFYDLTIAEVKNEVDDEEYNKRWAEMESEDQEKN